MNIRFNGRGHKSCRSATVVRNEYVFTNRFVRPNPRSNYEALRRCLLKARCELPSLYSGELVRSLICSAPAETNKLCNESLVVSALYFGPKISISAAPVESL